MALLSDLFTDLDQYKFVFGHMKTLFNARSHLENFDLGSVIYSLMKCVAVLGIVSQYCVFFRNTFFALHILDACALIKTSGFIAEKILFSKEGS